MVEKTYNIETHGLDKEARYRVIKEWIGKIEPMKIRSRESSIAAIVLFWITLFLFGFLIALIILIVWVIWDFIKKPTPIEILEDTPNFIKFKTGVIKNSYPTTVNVSNEDKICINYSVFGGQLFSSKIKERWNLLNNDLENIIKSAAGVESVPRSSDIINPEKASIGQGKTSLNKIQKLFLVTVGYTAFSWFLPFISSRNDSVSLIYFASKIPDMFSNLILSLILILAIIYLTLRAPHRIKARIILTFIFMLSQIVVIEQIDTLMMKLPKFLWGFVDINFWGLSGFYTPIVAFVVVFIEFISLKLKKTNKTKEVNKWL